MARGRSGASEIRAMEMTKWFDTNYHYIVPEFEANQSFRSASNKPATEFADATNLKIPAKPVLLGPISFLLLGKSHDGGSTLALLDRLIPVYAEVITGLAAAGADWIQIDEPIFVTDLSGDVLSAAAVAYEALAKAKGNARILLQTVFGHLGDGYQEIIRLPIDGLGLDFTRGGENLDLLAQQGFPSELTLAAGVVSGRNVWTNDLTASLQTLQTITETVSADRLMVSTSCSLMHVPYDVRLEDELDPTIVPWLAFAEQKLEEVVTLTRAVNDGESAVADRLRANREIIEQSRASHLRRNPTVRTRTESLPNNVDRRPLAYAERAPLQQDRLHLPLLPTTTIGSFPQTPELRSARRRYERGELDQPGYEQVISQAIDSVVAEQEALGLDVLVHGEPERNDMVQYFGEQLEGFAFTRHGWVQSYGSRCVRPPIIFGDVSRPHPMTVRWSTYAQSRTAKPMKGMLTGPVTILNWSFVRDDQPRSETCLQIALAIRDEVADLDAADIAVIQIDEPALREGLPLRHSEWDHYLAWATRSFRIAAASARAETQVHTHMCYCEFGSVIDAISDLDADVISIENARSDLELLDVFRAHGYDKGIGPGVYDIHSPRVPPVDEMAANLTATLTVLKPDQVWVNPDCGLKTRKPGEAHDALRNMVDAAQTVRSGLLAPV
jgi:5-methyltetrahydropteroyltriglutamate--homocysteine methyltransferase